MYNKCPYPFPPCPGSKAEIFAKYKGSLIEAISRASNARTNHDLEDALASIDFFLDKLHAELKGKNA